MGCGAVRRDGEGAGWSSPAGYRVVARVNDAVGGLSLAKMDAFLGICNIFLFQCRDE